MNGSSIALLFGTMLVLTIVPGPSDFAVVARAAGSGFRHGLLMIGGIIAADFLFILLAVYSLSMVAERWGGLFAVVQYLCAAYLVWLGFGMLRTTPGSADAPETDGFSGLSSFVSGLLITLGDPKAILFYMGLLPAFVELSSISLADTLTIMVTATIAIASVKTVYAYLADRARRFFENSAAQRTLDIAAGVVLMGTGVFLFWRA